MLKFKKHKETIYTFPGKELRIERVSRGISRVLFAERMTKITGIVWYKSKVTRLEDVPVNDVTEETKKAILKALQ